MFFVFLISLALIPVHFAVQTIQNSPNSFDIGTLLVQLGLSGVFFWQWRTERTERIKERDLRIQRDDQVISILERQGPILVQAVDTLKEVQASQRAVVPPSQDWSKITTDLQRASEMLRDELNKHPRS